jgi:ligand-binding sensor domain-containing protein
MDSVRSPNHFLQDSRGYIWSGTRNGVTLFDGIHSIKFQQSDNNKNSLTVILSHVIFVLLPVYDDLYTL